MHSVEDLDALLELADLLETVPDDQFDMSSYAKGPGLVGECGTTACAAGWATTLPVYQKRGLKIGCKNAWNSHCLNIDPEFDSEVFGITSDEFYVLFLGDLLASNYGETIVEDILDLKNASKQLVAARIRTFVEWRRSLA